MKGSALRNGRGGFCIIEGRSGVNIDECINPDERYVYEERLAWLGVNEREPTEQEQRMAMEDVLAYRKKVSELVEETG
jgi:hypothetical protein